MIREVDDRMMVGGQLYPERIAGLEVSMIVNNRPDGEEPGQPTSDEIEAAARAAGIAYRHIPVSGGLSQPLVAAMEEALGATEGPVLAFCKSGMRSIFLWALARARMGDDGETIAAKAAAAGYDVTPIRAYLG
jgi:uncharacterized protein (TIGR01244 family)